jgi:hypothetical protein
MHWNQTGHSSWVLVRDHEIIADLYYAATLGMYVVKVFKTNRVAPLMRDGTPKQLQELAILKVHGIYMAQIRDLVKLTNEIQQLRSDNDDVVGDNSGRKLGSDGSKNTNR